MTQEPQTDALVTRRGAVVAGPAPRPLPAQQIKVAGGSIFLA